MSLGRHILKVANRCIATGGHATTDIMIKWADQAEQLASTNAALLKALEAMFIQFVHTNPPNDAVAKAAEAIRKAKSQHGTLKGE